MFDQYNFISSSRKIIDKNTNEISTDIEYVSQSINKFSECFEVISYKGELYKRNGYYDGDNYYFEQPWYEVNKVKKVVIDFE